MAAKWNIESRWTTADFSEQKKLKSTLAKEEGRGEYTKEWRKGLATKSTRSP